MNYFIFAIIAIIAIAMAVIVYYIIKGKNTEYIHTLVLILKNEIPEDYVGGTKTSFNLLPNIAGLSADKIWIQRKEKLVWGIHVSYEFIIKKSFSDEADDSYIL